MADRKAPIGVFDSGVGGLTVAREIMRQIPEERIVYFGDTARVPYGSKSRDTIIKYSRQIIRFLKTQGVKAIVVACNTASAVALEDVRKELDIPIIGVIKAGARTAAAATHNGRIGIIATETTINSKVYTHFLEELNPGLCVIGKACPLFVPLVEEGTFLKDPITEEIASRYLQELKEKRTKSRYKGSHGQWIGSEIPNPFGSCLYCKDCGSKLTAIQRQTSAKVRKYYICSTYNTKGKRYCAKAHLIEEQNLMDDVVRYIRMCRNALCDVIAAYDIKDFAAEQKTVEEKCASIQAEIDEVKHQLRTLFSQKIKDISSNPGNEALIKESYDSIQQELTARVHALELKYDELKCTELETPNVKEKLRTALEVVDNIIKKGTLNRKDIEILVERIEVDENGLPEIELKYGLSRLVHYSPAEELNRYENEIILTVMRLIRDDDRGFTSAKYLSKKLTDMGYSKSKKSVLPYVTTMIEKGIVEPCENKLKPYTIIKSQAELEEMIADICKSCEPCRMKGTADGHEVHDEYTTNLHNNNADRRHAGDGI